MNLLPKPRSIRPGAGTLASDLARPEVRLGAPGLGPQAYRLAVTPEKAVIEAGDAAGAFYARTTLSQLARGGSVPAVTIEDSPDFLERGVMLDVSRDKVPTMATLYRLVDELASWKINRLQLYMEHTFAYRAHRDVWANASPFTGDEIEALDAYCRERFIELVPNQNSFGHMERWLKLPRYAPLAEVAEPQGDYMSLCPIDPRSLSLLAGLYDELLPHFTSRSFNVGCDETIDLGKGRSKEEALRLGVGPVYLAFLEKIHALVAARGRRMQFWGDIVLEHPELISSLPKDVLALEWGYEADHPFDDEGARFADAGIEYQVVPGTSAWLSLGGRTTNALGNLSAAARAGRAHGATGMMVTDWGDFGHWQPLPVSYLGLAYGAAVAWGLDANRDLDVPAMLDTFVFSDGARVMGRVAYDLGEVYRLTGVAVKNASVLALLLLFPERPLGEGRLAGLTVEGLERARAGVDAAIAPLSRARSNRDDAATIAAELDLAAALMRHACDRGIARLTGTSQAALGDELRGIIDEYERIWRLRNREGGLVDSVGRLKRLL
ncbi:MAG TPA: family 20 glycosylhydrolase [Candidatus Polarisedimenticolaceae bacterium]|nr:family 20 glycosylhydrolase [Candidatus Polarisedimenticolaceae bacterium]